MSADSSRAVFVSYASQDAGAALALRDALRAAGVEVWFDQAELVGGDAWDAKIRGQISSCALFVPVISAHTQARLEGYFRLEWKLAAQRTHAMAEARAFLLPVVIDATRDAEAHVPAEFKAVQWTRLPGGANAEAFCRRVQALLQADGVRPAPAAENSFASASSPQAPRRRWLPPAVAAAALAGAAMWWAARERPSAAPAPTSSASPAAPAAPTTPRRGAKSIVVLPFENLSDDKESGYFADGMQDDVITNLLLIRDLSCVPRATAMTYRGTKKTNREIAAELGVAYVLTGTVRRADRTLRIVGTLIDARTDDAVWTRPYQKDLTDVFAIQSELAQAIATELKAKLSPAEQTRVARRATEDPAAYDLFLKARTERNNATGGGKPTLDRQIAWLEAAVARDPGFGIAWAYLGRAHALYYRNNHDHSAARLEQARNAIERASQLAPDTPEVALNLGDYYYFCFRDYARATEAFARAAEMQPGAPQPCFVLANVQRAQGRWSEAWANYLLTTERDPAFIDGLAQTYGLALAGRRFDDARRVALRVAELQRAIAAPRARELPNEYDGYLANLAFAASGSTAEGDSLLRRFEADPRTAASAHTSRLNLAAERGDAAEIVRLDGVRPATSNLGVVRVATALAALGRREAIATRLGDIPERLRARLQLEPENVSLWSYLAQFEALLGHKDEALRCVARQSSIVPLARDHWRGVLGEVDLAFVYTWTGDTRQAVAAYGRLLSIPVLPETYVITVHTLRHGIWYAPLRGNPDFEALLNDARNTKPLF
jgi:TolB-like protein/cytochrome c-type biogenesis protein CcmH/NrfG